MSSTVLVNGTIITGFAKLQNCGLFMDQDGTIGDIFNMKRFEQKSFPANTQVIDVQGAYITPGFIDTHIHGIGGFGTEDATVESILGMSERLADFGVSAFLPTIYTDKIERMFASIDAIVAAIGYEKGATILGINLEGPFISQERLGAQNAEGVKSVDIDLFNRLIAAGKGHVICMTVAPELKGMRELALTAIKNGIVLLAGHTNATYENIIEGMQAGILHSTHFFNAMSRLHHRNPGTVGAIMIQQDMQCEIIADGVHVHPELVKLLLREKQTGNIVLVTDSLKPTMQTSGELRANGEVAVLANDGAFHRKVDPDTLLGSSLTMLKGVENLVSWEIPIEAAVQMATSNPARIYDFEMMGRLSPGYMANVVVFNKNFNIKGLFVKGQLIRDRF
ncbi:MAG: N-acetylglucosamine-6-phosphate deacetylase [Spirochaetae bacterium HGW-Spirochaetae-8]|jgi:N-acetylglucosamine-6-phosphate deacetylase|nr:MAG: N-acetylglucosamine-6-phosphate deacetylase [Spirochaetae bacterium HGW-Spirochaetae-8]